MDLKEQAIEMVLMMEMDKRISQEFINSLNPQQRVENSFLVLGIIWKLKCKEDIEKVAIQFFKASCYEMSQGETDNERIRSFFTNIERMADAWYDAKKPGLTHKQRLSFLLTAGCAKLVKLLLQKTLQDSDKEMIALLSTDYIVIDLIEKLKESGIDFASIPTYNKEAI